jgi:hypothetical protein
MSSRNTPQSGPPAALLALTASAPAAAVWWWLTGSLKTAIETYEAEHRAIVAAVAEHRRLYDADLMDTSATGHPAAARRSKELNAAATRAYEKFMRELKRLAHMPPPAPSADARPKRTSTRV